MLTIKAHGVSDVMSFPFLDSPPREALERALLQLLALDAISESGDITDIGQSMAKLPLTPSLSRVLLAAAHSETDCLLDVIDIVSALTVENVFRNTSSEQQKEEAAIARTGLRRREGDHLTLLTTVQGYIAEHSDRRAWADGYFVSHRAMQAVSVRRFLVQDM